MNGEQGQIMFDVTYKLRENSPKIQELHTRCLYCAFRKLGYSYGNCSTYIFILWELHTFAYLTLKFSFHWEVYVNKASGINLPKKLCTLDSTIFNL